MPSVSSPKKETASEKLERFQNIAGYGPEPEELAPIMSGEPSNPVNTEMQSFLEDQRMMNEQFQKTQDDQRAKIDEGMTFTSTDDFSEHPKLAFETPLPTSPKADVPMIQIPEETVDVPMTVASPRVTSPKLQLTQNEPISIGSEPPAQFTFNPTETETDAQKLERFRQLAGYSGEVEEPTIVAEPLTRAVGEPQTIVSAGDDGPPGGWGPPDGPTGMDVDSPPNTPKKKPVIIDSPKKPTLSIGPGTAVKIPAKVRPKLVSRMSSISLPHIKPVLQIENKTLADVKPVLRTETSVEKTKPPKKDDGIELLRRRLKKLEMRKPDRGYKPLVNPLIVHGGRGGSGAASSSSSSSGAGGRGQGIQQKQAQQIIIQKGGRKKKKPSELTALRKKYNAQKKLTFKKVLEIKKLRTKSNLQNIKNSGKSKKEQKSIIVSYKKALASKHVAFKRQFPASSRIKSVPTLKDLIVKLMKPSF
jgi:hypothetical protein